VGAHALSQNLAAGLLFFTSSLIASLVLYLWSRPPRGELAGTGAAAIFLSVLLGLPGVIYAKAMVLLAYWALAAFAYTFIGAMFSKAHLSRLPTLIGMIVPPAFTIGTLPLLTLMSFLTPATLDYYLYAFDGSYGFQPGFLAARIVQGTDWLRLLTEACYINLPAGLTVLYCLERQRNTQSANRYFVLVIALAVAGFAGYFLFPGVGTVVMFGPAFPDHPPVLGEVAVSQGHPFNHPRNCIPSMHTAWAFAIWWCSRRLGSAGKALFSVYVLFTLVYTLSCGHYLVDMVVAAPFTVLIYGLVFATERRLVMTELVAAAAMLFGWLVFLRFGEPVYLASPAVPWALTGLTLAASALVLRRLAAKNLYLSAFHAINKPSAGTSSQYEMNSLPTVRQ
jgi:hypothetical protein